MYLQYPLLSHLLSNAGYTVVATPFAVTFNHVECAKALHEVSRYSAVQPEVPVQLGGLLLGLYQVVGWLRV